MVEHTGTVTVRADAETVAAARALGASWSEIGAMLNAAAANVNVISTLPRRF